MQSKTLTRYTIYITGMTILALGIILNTKTNLGVSPLISMPFAVSQIWHFNFAFMAFVMYAAFTVIEIILEGKSRKATDWLQIPFSVGFSLLLQIFDSGYDQITSLLDISADTLPERFIMLLVGIMFTGIGVSMSVNMKLIPNPADGLAKVVGDVCKRNMGFGKNLIDTISVSITCIMSILASGHIIGVGIGTIAAMIGVGRCIYAFNYFFKDKMLKISGLTSKN